MPKVTEASQVVETTTLACPLCGSTDGGLMTDLTSPGSCECGVCSNSFTIQEAVQLATEHLRRWQAIAGWLETMPKD